MTVHRVGGVEVVTVVLSPAAVLVLDRVARDAYRGGRYAGQARAALVEAVTAVNAAAAETAAAGRGTSQRIAGDRRAVAVAALTPSPVPAADEPAWISTEEAARRLGRTEGHTRWLARQGRLTARRAPGGGWRFDPADVACWGARPA